MTLHDPLLGTFAYDPTLEQFQLEHGGLWLSVQSEKSLPQLRAILEDLEHRLAPVKAFAAERLLKEKNTQHPDPAGPLSVEQFAGRLRLEALQVDDDGATFYSFDDGGLFFGHVVNVHQNPDGSFENCWWDG